MISVKIHRKKKSKRKPGKRAATKFKKPSKNTEPKAPKGETKKVKVRSEIEESMVQSIISSETQTELAPAIKSIFEQTKEVDVVESLTDYIQNKEIEIQRMCESNFQGFIRSVDDLMLVREGIDKVREAVQKLNDEVQENGSTLVTKTQELVEMRMISQHIGSAMEILGTCQYILSLCAKAKEYVANKKFYPAIKILDQLQQIHLKNITEFEFGKYLDKNIPLIKESIKKQVTEDVNSWLLDIREKAQNIGKFATAQTEAEVKQRDELAELRQKDAREYADTIVAKRARAASSLPQPNFKQDGSVTLTSDDITEISVFEKVKVNFATLYQCSYIYDSLGEKDEFQKYYKEQRKEQARLALQLREQQNFMKSYKDYMFEVAGFFIVEATVLQTSNDLISSYDVSMLWDVAMNKVKSMLQVETAYCTETKQLSQLKDFLLVFSRTLRKYGYDVSPLIDFVRLPLRDRFVLVSLSNVTTSIEDLLREPDAYVPLVISSEKEAKEVLKENTLDAHFEPGTKSFPFSGFLPKVSKGAKGFITLMAKFAQNLPDMDSVIYKATEQLLKILTGLLLGKTQEAQRALINQLQVAQAYLNGFYLEKIIPALEAHLKQSGITTPALQLNYKETFSMCTEKLQELLFSVNARRIDEEFDKFTTKLDTKPSSRVAEPREYIANIIKDITTNFPKMNGLPKTVYENMYHRAYQHIARRLVELISSDKVVKFNLSYIASVNEDLTLVEDSLKKSPINGLLEYFTELRQIIDLIMSSDLLAYMDLNVRAKLYPKISSPKKLLNILEKFQEDMSLTKLFTSGTKAKQVAALIQRLKGAPGGS